MTNTAAARISVRRFAAKFPGTCAVTGRRFDTGTSLMRVTNGYALADAQPVKPAVAPVVVSCEIAELGAADFFAALDGYSGRRGALAAYGRMPVVGRTAVVAELQRRLAAGEIADTLVRAWTVAFVVAAACAVQVYSPDHDVTFHVEPTVSLGADDQMIHVHVPENYVLRAAASKELAVRTLTAIKSALAAAGVDGRVQSTRRGEQRFVWSATGYVHMGQFCSTGRTARIRVADAA